MKSGSQMVDHLKTRAFVNRSTSDHSKAGHVWFSDPHCTLNPQESGNPDTGRNTIQMVDIVMLYKSSNLYPTYLKGNLAT